VASITGNHRFPAQHRDPCISTSSFENISMLQRWRHFPVTGITNNQEKVYPAIDNFCQSISFVTE
jgi:hypothetical protein